MKDGMGKGVSRGVIVPTVVRAAVAHPQKTVGPVTGDVSGPATTAAAEAGPGAVVAGGGSTPASREHFARFRH